MKIFTYRIILRSRLMIGTGQPSATADDTFPRRRDGQPIIPATAIKGAARAAAAAAGVDDVDLARCFGRSGRHAGAAVFADAVPQRSAGLDISEVTTVELDRNRVPVPGALAALEVLMPMQPSGEQWQPAQFEGRLWAASGEPSDLEPAFIGLAGLTDLGARGRRGFGRIQVALPPEVQEFMS